MKSTSAGHPLMRAASEADAGNWPVAAHERRTILSGDGLHRLMLWREWSLEVRRYVVFIGLNPSTADAFVDDRTIRRCIAFAKLWGMDALCMLNLFTLRATDPDVMKSHPEPVAPGADDALAEIARSASLVVAAWGVDGAHQRRDAAVLDALRRCGTHVQCLGTTKHGFPRHPLYVRGDTPLRAFQVGCGAS